MGFLDRLFGQTSKPDDTRKLNACVVHAGGLLGIVGESYHQDELRAVARRTTDAGPFREDLVDYAAEVADTEPERRWFMAVLVREADNPKDPDAIAVHAQGGGKIGYLKTRGRATLRAGVPVAGLSAATKPPPAQRC
jgi:hypothetical protein